MCSFRGCPFVVEAAQEMLVDGFGKCWRWFGNGHRLKRTGRCALSLERRQKTGNADLHQFLIVAPAMLIPSFIGARVYTRFSEKTFTRVVLIALGASGLALVVNASRALLA